MGRGGLAVSEALTCMCLFANWIAISMNVITPPAVHHAVALAASAFLCLSTFSKKYSPAR